ncbi:MAG: hypothetical protein J0G97_04885, partial [Rhizobium pusense]|nr:hypothetical protein [Agrobacterium pusense]
LKPFQNDRGVEAAGIGENDFLNVFRECHSDVHLHDDGIGTPPFPWDFGTFTVQPEMCEALFREISDKTIDGHA